ncbi:MAG: methylmalonyl-CoA epimerase [Chloroflexi bacterium]|nr:methylmalonyl-CoA epimerase [Chloroflexota bacterium]
MLKKVDHVTMVVKNLDEALKSFEKIVQLTPEKNRAVGELPECRIAMLATREGARIELIQPKPGTETRFSRFLAGRGEGVFGLSLFVTDFDAEVNRMKQNGIPLEMDYQAAVHPQFPFRIAWVPPTESHGVWLEFVDAEALPPGIRPS